MNDLAEQILACLTEALFYGRGALGDKDSLALARKIVALCSNHEDVDICVLCGKPCMTWLDYPGPGKSMRARGVINSGFTSCTFCGGVTLFETLDLG